MHNDDQQCLAKHQSALLSNEVQSFEDDAEQKSSMLFMLMLNMLICAN
jgi:hypothetical protein